MTGLQEPAPAEPARWAVSTAPGEPADRRAQATGALAALAIALGIAGAGLVAEARAGELASLVRGIEFDLGQPFTSEWFVFLGLFGAPIVTVLGWLLAPMAIRAERWAGLVGVVLLMAVGTVFFASFEVVGVSLGMQALGHVPSGTATVDPMPLLEAAFAVVVLGLIGVLVVGPFALVVTVPAAIAWLALVRLAGRPRLDRART
ncbi:MAG TPA: hypothetical protein VGQ47_03655 [Candidatus Limnocylindrales bacterium]|jgi:hypothetical protein|nr:hypothetical protein [Candidatus Limnocylindrales bacterium]